MLTQHYTQGCNYRIYTSPPPPPYLVFGQRAFLILGTKTVQAPCARKLRIKRIVFHDKAHLPQFFKIGLHPIRRDASTTAPQLWYAKLLAKPRGKYKQFGADSTINDTVGKWHSPSSKLREAAAVTSFWRSGSICQYFQGKFGMSLNRSLSLSPRIIPLLPEHSSTKPSPSPPLQIHITHLRSSFLYVTQLPVLSIWALEARSGCYVRL